jgi:NAD(P)-dependent dehydrogenase (short-subunit alcohol dehydrogenase family)
VSTIREMSDLKGRRAIITGAMGNLGSVIADSLAELGADLYLVDRPGSDFVKKEAELTSRWGVNVVSMACDLESESDRTLLMSAIKSDALPVNILVNNAAFVGTSNLTGWGVPFEEQTMETWRRAMEVNLTSAFHLCQGLWESMKSAKGASIVNIGSIYGSLGPDWSLYEGTDMSNPAAYGASKGGLIQLTRWLSTTMAPSVRVNCISPGGIFRNQPERFVQRYEQRTPLKRMAKEEDFKGGIAYMASDLSAYVTGQHLMIDGGWGIW